jgi:hypothetical protein
VSVVTKVVIFWLLIGFSLIGLWYALGHEIRFSLSDVLVPAVFVGLTFWFKSRVSASRRSWVSVLMVSVLSAIVAGMSAVFKFQTLRYGLGGRRGLVEGEVSAAVFVVCIAVSIWAFLRFRRAALG